MPWAPERLNQSGDRVFVGKVGEIGKKLEGGPIRVVKVPGTCANTQDNLIKVSATQAKTIFVPKASVVDTLEVKEEPLVKEEPIGQEQNIDIKDEPISREDTTEEKATSGDASFSTRGEAEREALRRWQEGSGFRSSAAQREALRAELPQPGDHQVGSLTLFGYMFCIFSKANTNF